MRQQNSPQRKMRLRHRPRTFPANSGNLERLSERIEQLMDRRKQEIADALAAMSGAAGAGAASAGNDAPPPDIQPAETERAFARREGLDRSEANVPPPRVSAATLAAHARVENSIYVKRTLIPMLLTLGLLLPAIASLKWLMPPDSPFAAWQPRYAFIVIATGPFLLFVAALNMLSVRHQMRQRDRQQRHAV